MGQATCYRLRTAIIAGAIVRPGTRGAFCHDALLFGRRELFSLFPILHPREPLIKCCGVAGTLPVAHWKLPLSG
jgi:hypothetical protein